MLEFVIGSVQGYSGTMPSRGANTAVSDGEQCEAIEYMLQQLP